MLGSCRLATVLVLACPLVAAQKEVPDAHDFRRRGLGDVAVLGDYLYFEGGEVAQYVLGEDDVRDSRESNVTLSVSLKSGWNNESITFTEIDRGNKPIVKDNIIWADPDGKRLYQWDGRGPFERTAGAKDPKMWSFKPDDGGKGEWAIARPKNPSIYNSLLRTAAGTGAVCDDKAYSIGGFGTKSSDAHFDSESNPVPVPGMVTVNLATQEWSNRSLADMAPPYGSYIRGEAACVEGFGDASYVFTIGGRTTSPDTTTNGEAVSMRNITFWDVKNERWLWQETTGDTPKGRWDHCVAGHASNATGNATYEIFVYGGRNNVNKDLDDVWILTLPAFHWIRVDVSSPPRYYHSCAVIGSGQIISSGGYSSGGWVTDDPWVNGIGVFDLVTLGWATEYDEGAEEYRPAAAVRDWYDREEMGNMRWSSKEVEDVFASKSGDSNGDGEGGEEGGNGSNDDDQGSSTPVGDIVGGVVGGVAIIALAIAGFFFWRRRSRRQKAMELNGTATDASTYQPVAGSSSPSHPAHGYHSSQEGQYYEYKPGGGQAQMYSAELGGGQDVVAPSELDGAAMPLSELHGSGGVHNHREGRRDRNGTHESEEHFTGCGHCY